MTDTKQPARRPMNPAKAYLIRYRMLLREWDALDMALKECRERAKDCSVKLKPIHVQGGGACYDRMAEDVAKAADAEAQLQAVLDRKNAALAEILEAVGAVPDDAQRVVLTLRFVTGFTMEQIMDCIGYERSRTYELYGWGLWHVKQWMIRKGLIKEGVQGGAV